MREADGRPASVSSPPSPEDGVVCASCGKDLWWRSLPPAMEGNVWVCGECDAAINFDSLEE
jgi:hypothetical protein